MITPAPPQTVEVLPGTLVEMYPTTAPKPLSPLGAAPAPAVCALGPDSSGGEGGGGGGGSPPEEALIVRDSAAFFVGADGKATRRSPLQFAEPPRALAAGRGYVVALLPGRAEVRGAARLGGAAAAQALPLAGLTVCAPAPARRDGALFAATGAAPGSIVRLAPVPLERQARLLAAAGDYPGERARE